MPFDPLPDSDLQRLDDESLVAYGRAARDAGHPAASRRALAFLVYGHERDVIRRVSLRVPRHAVEDVARDALVRAIAAAFDGTSVGEFRSWLNTIIERTAADFYRRAGRRPKETELPGEHGGEEALWEAEPSVESETGAIELRIVIEDTLASLSDTHRQVVELHVFEGRPARDVCATIEGMTEANVAQIASRFRARLRERLEHDG